MANEKLKDENKILKLNISKKDVDQSPSSTFSHEEYIIPCSLTPPQSYISVSSPERSDSVSSPPTSPDTVMNAHTVLVCLFLIILKNFVIMILLILLLCVCIYIYIIKE